MVGVHLINLACSTLESLVYVIFKIYFLFFFFFFSVDNYIICSKKIHKYLCSIVVVIKGCSHELQHRSMILFM